MVYKVNNRVYTSYKQYASTHNREKNMACLFVCNTLFAHYCFAFNHDR